MPLYPPRNEPIKKKLQLSQALQELLHAIRNNFSTDKLNKAAENYRLGKLSLLKAQIHEFRERQFQSKGQLNTVEKLETAVLAWTNKKVEDIIAEARAELKKK